MNKKMKVKNRSKYLIAVALAALAGAGVSHGALLYSGDAGVFVTGVTTVETGFESVYDTGAATPFVSTNGLVKQTGTTFDSSEISGFESAQIQNIFYPTSDNGPDNPWLPTSNGTEYVGISLASAITIEYIGFGTQYTNRSSGTYNIEYTTDNTTWNTVGTVQLVSSGNVLGRNLFDVGSLANVTGIRIEGTPDVGLGSASVSVSELEVYSVPEPKSVTLLLGTFGVLTVVMVRRRRARLAQ